MRWCLLCLSLLATLVTAQQQQDQKARLQGQVITAAGAPLSKTTVRLQAASQMNQTNFANYAVSSDRDGKFLFDDVIPGTYVLVAERTGYLHMAYGSKPQGAGATQMKLDAGQEIKDIVIKLTPQAILFGKVVDEDGDPLPNFSVLASRWAFVNGKKQLQVTGNQLSLADGTFVMGGLPAGRYYVSAESGRGIWTDGVDLSGGKKSADSHLKTYFPSALDSNSAALVDVAPGAEIRGIEIHVRRGRVFEIRGKAESDLGGSVPMYLNNLTLITKGAAGYGLWDQKEAEIGEQTGTFQFKSVAPGTYVIRGQSEVEVKDPTGQSSKSVKLAANLEVTVLDKDLENVVVPLTPGMEIKGTVKTEGADPPTQPPGVRLPRSVVFHDALDLSGDLSEVLRGLAEVSEDGTFRMEGASPSVVRVDVFGLAESSYVKSIRFGGREVKGAELDLTSGRGGEMEIVLSPNGAEVTGIVRDSDGKPVPGAVVQVCDVQTCDKDGVVTPTRAADQNGAFDIKGLAPGEYKVFVWEDDGDGVITDPGFRKSFASQAVVVKLSEKSQESIAPALITKDAMEVEAAKIR